jgi:SAM-dependent MidA family methyltransferase
MEELIGERGGEVSFRDFMDLALYHPRWGYYSAASPRYGRSGDFLTAPTASGWYAAVIGRWLTRLVALTGQWTVVDLAAGDGSFLARLDEATRDPVGPPFERAVGVERSPAMRSLQERKFVDLSVPAQCSASLTEVSLSPGPVVLHACELYDAFPVHRVVARKEGLNELWVKVEEDRLAWCEHPAPLAVREYLFCHRVTLVEGQVAEVNLDARAAHRSALSAVSGAGLALTLDYGYPAGRLYDSRGRYGGSLACYSGHTMSRDPFEAPGEQDLTAHVNWDDLRLAGADAGWSEVGLWPLAELLIRAGLAALVEDRGLGIEADLDAATVTERQEIKRLLDPEGMGSDLKVLIQVRGDLENAVRDSLSEQGVG